MLVGTGAIVTAVSHASVGLLFAGTAAAGAHGRAGVLSILYVVAYLAMGLPAVLGGLRVVHGGGLLTTAHEFGLAVMLLAASALIGTLARRPLAARAPQLVR